MSRSVSWLLLGIVAVSTCGLAVWAREGASNPVPETPTPEAKRAVEPIAPVLPGEIVSALQAGEVDRALEQLDAWLERDDATEEDRAYAALIRGMAYRRAGRLEQSAETLRAAIETGGPWASKLRFELAETELAARRPDQAEALASLQVDALLDPSRKDRLAGVYLAFAERLLEPEEPTANPDPETAYALLKQARSLAKGATLQARTLYRMLKASQAAGNHARAIQNADEYLNAYPQGEDRFAVRYQRGAALLAIGQRRPARLAWTDLARDLKGEDGDQAATYRPLALFRIAETYGIPQPPNDTALELGVSALRRFLEAYPSHEKTVRAAYQIGAAFQARGRTGAALEAYRAFLREASFRAETEDARAEYAELRMSVAYQIGALHQARGEFDQAIEAFQGYLAQYPDGPRSADAQRQILNTQVMIANDHYKNERYEQARDAWRRFVSENPLDGRVPQLLFQVGQSHVAEEDFDAAIAAWETLIGKFPDSEPAAHAEFQIGVVLETELAQLEQAIARYQRVRIDPWKSRAQARIAQMQQTALSVVTPRTFRSDETTTLAIRTRNIETLTLRAYRLDPETYFRKKLALQGVETLDVGLVAPDHEWTVEVPGYAKYAPIQHDYELEPLETPGVHVVKISDEKNLQATTLVLSSDLDAILKTSREQLLVYAQNPNDGSGRPGARVLIAQGGEVIFEDETSEDGVLLADWPEARDPNAQLSYLILDGPNAAGTGLQLPSEVARGLDARAYLATDRPAYRPGQEAQIRGVIREVKDGRYVYEPGAAYRLEVVDSRGRRILGDELKLSDFGTFHRSVPIGSAAPVGTYRIRVFQPNGSTFNGSFEVQAYQLQKVELDVELPKTVHFRGETVEGEVIARYAYGAPFAGRAVEVNLPDGRTLSGETNDEGRYDFSFETTEFGEERPLPIVARLPEEGVTASAMAVLAVRAFRIEIETLRDVFLDGESFRLTARTTDPNGDPVAQELDVTVLERVERRGTTAEREVQSLELTTDEESGAGSVELAIEDPKGGDYVLRVSGTDRFGNAISEEKAIRISGTEDANKLRILADRQTFRVGEPAEVTVLNRSGAGPALVTWEADRILNYRVVPLDEGTNRLTWDAAEEQFPNFTLAAARMTGSAFHQARIDLEVERGLKVTIEPSRPSVGPGEEFDVRVRTTDQLDRPVSAEVALALIDQALLRLYDDPLPPIDPFFYDQTRTGAFTTEATNTFRYEPPTVPVAEAVVEDRERARLAQQEAQRVERLKEQGTLETLGALNDAVALRRRGRDEVMFDEERGEMEMSLSAPSQAPAPAAANANAMRNDQAAGFGVQPGDVDFMFGGGAVGGGGLGGRAAGRRFSQMRGGMTGGSVLLFRGAEPRQQFIETAYWNPSVVTDKNGEAIVTLKAPSALANYQFQARGVTAAETLVGQATADLRVKKDFFVELRAPRLLVEGDEPRLMARVHHAGVRGSIELRLRIYPAGGREEVYIERLKVDEDGVEEALFDSFTVPDARSMELTLTARAEGAADELSVEVPVRPWGVEEVVSASGVSQDDRTVFLELPPGPHYESPEMTITLAPSIQRMIIELALGASPIVPLPRSESAFPRIAPPLPGTVADRASDLLAATSALAYLRRVGGSEAPEASRLSSRAQGLVSELVAIQNEDGGWPWVAARPEAPCPSDPLTTARVVWALSEAETFGLLSDRAAADRADAYLIGRLPTIDASGLDIRAAIVHALSTRGEAGFEQANRLNRDRQRLSNVALAYLTLTFANLDRDAMAREVLAVLGPKSKTIVPRPGDEPLRYWEPGTDHPWFGGRDEATALAALAYAEANPEAEELRQAVAWLLEHRQPWGWQPRKANGPALAALGRFYGSARTERDDYGITVTVNDEVVHEASVEASASEAVIPVPRSVIDLDGRNMVRFQIEGRGRFGYTATLRAFTRDFEQRKRRDDAGFAVHKRAYLAADPRFEGQPIPSGFSSVQNQTAFQNPVTEIPYGGRAKVELLTSRFARSNRPNWSNPFLIIEEPLPAGARLVEGSLQSGATHHEVLDDRIVLYFAPDRHPGSITYEIAGGVPGSYRILPTRMRSAYEPGRTYIGPAASIQVLSPGETSSDPYRPTPDELLAIGRLLFEQARYAEAAEPLGTLWEEYTLRDDLAADVARKLLTIHIEQNNPRQIVQFFEILREKAPGEVIPFEEIAVIGRAYRELGEHERAYLVWRATAEASYLEDARVGEALRQRGRPLEAVAYLLELWRDYPNTASIESDFFGLSQVLGALATSAETDPEKRQRLFETELAPADLTLQSIRLIQVFLAQSPDNPIADEASLALATAFLELESEEKAVALAQRFAEIYRESQYLDSFRYIEALGRFRLGEYARAIEVAKTIAQASYTDERGARTPSPNKWRALYILGQIYHARRQADQAVEYYRQVDDRFSDAAGAVRQLTRKSLELPEVTILRPSELPEVAEAGLDREAAEVVFAADAARGEPKPTVELTYRNLSEAQITVYPVDLMRLYLTRRNLDAIAGIDLAGITPLVETTVMLEEPARFEALERSVPLPIESEGAYLVMVRGEDLHASGIALVSPLELDVLEEPESGRVRVTVRHAETGELIPNAQARVIGSENDRFSAGETDLRGVYVAEGIRGQVTAVVRLGTDQYAFHRGRIHLGAPPAAPEVPAEGRQAGQDADRDESLDADLKGLNRANQLRQLDRLQDRYQERGKGVQVEKAY